MSANKDTVYLKLEKNTIIQNRHVVLSDIAKITGTNQSILRQLKQMKIYSFQSQPKKKKLQIQVFSTMKVIEMIQEEYPNVEVQNLGEKDFILEYNGSKEKAKWIEILKATMISIIIFFGAAFTIMAFNNDISVTDVFAKLYLQVMGTQSNGFTELEVCYSIGLSIGVLVFFNHIGKKKITPDPTPIQVEMRKYEKDIEDAFIGNAGRGGKTIDVD